METRGIGGFKLSGLYVPCETHGPECADAVPVGIELVPGQTVPGGLRVGVMVVVPSFSEGE